MSDAAVTACESCDLAIERLHPVIVSLVRLARARTEERDDANRERDRARLGRDLALMERDTLRELLSVALTRLHDSEARIRRLEQQQRGMFGLDDEQWRDVQPRGRAA